MKRQAKDILKIKWIVSRNNDDFIKHFALWKNSWELAFNKKISANYIKRYYLEPPLNNSIVIFGYAKNEIVASSTLVPLIFKCPKSFETINYYHYISAFVLPGFSNGLNTYQQMVNLVKNQMTNSKCNFIIAFPNAKAKHLLLLLGGFKMIDEGFFIESKLDNHIITKFSSEIDKPFFDKNMLSWRIENSGINEENGLFYEFFSGKKKLLDVTYIKLNQEFNGYIPWWSSWGQSPSYPVDDYKFNLCIYPFSKNFIFKRSFLLSDVF